MEKVEKEQKKPRESMEEYAPFRYNMDNTRLLNQVINERERNKAVNAHEVLMTSANPMVKEQQIQHKISSDMKMLEKEKFLDEKRKILLHKNEDEIRELDVQITRAHIQRELVNQKALRQKRIEEEKQANSEEKKYYEGVYKRNIEIAKEEEREEMRRKTAFRQQLIKQMQEREKLRDLEKEVVKKEREERKRLLSSIKQDIEKEKQQMQEMKQMLRDEEEEYFHNLVLYKSQQKADAEEDLRKQLELIRQRNEENRLREEKKKKEMQEREAISERIGREVYIQETEKQKYNETLEELLIDERVAKDDLRYKEDSIKKVDIGRCLRQDFQKYFRMRDQRVLRKREEKKRQSKEQLEILLDLKRKDHEVKRMKFLNNKQKCQDLLNAIEYKKLLHKFEVSQNKIKYDQQIEFQKKRQQEIEAEKLQMLMTMPLEDLKFLPVKAISDEHRSILLRKKDKFN